MSRIQDNIDVLCLLDDKAGVEVKSDNVHMIILVKGVKGKTSGVITSRLEADLEI